MSKDHVCVLPEGTGKIIFPVQTTELSQHKRDLISWLDGYKNTVPIRKVVAGCKMDDEEVSEFIEKLIPHLVPKQRIDQYKRSNKIARRQFRSTCV